MREVEINHGKNVELGELRIKLDQMTERITSRFKDRSRFPQNSAIYVPDGVPIAGRSGISLFQFAVEGLESYHASLGRYEDSDQYPVIEIDLPPAGVLLPEKEQILPRIEIKSSDGLMSFYQGLVESHCAPGDDPNSYGETAYIDADLVLLMHDRVNIGRYVAEVKGRSDPSVYSAKNNTELLLSKLKDSTREEALIGKVRNTAMSYDLNPEMVTEAFRWMIDKTIDIEIAYINGIER